MASDDHPDLDDFKRRIDFSALDSRSTEDGVRADWDGLPGILHRQRPLGAKRPYADDIDIFKSGLGLRTFCWKGKDTLVVKIHVSGIGPAGARQLLLEHASATTMGRIPYASRPGQLGDLAVHFPGNPSRLILWIYRNVFVLVDNDGTNLDVGPAAQAIQHFMERHRVWHLLEHLPKVGEVKVSSGEIHVGDEFQVSVGLGKGVTPDSLVTGFAQDMACRLRQIGRGLMTVTYRAEKPGRAIVDVLVMERKTLLSPPLTVVVDVLPGESRTR
jgi:hypothetical protein